MLYEVITWEKCTRKDRVCPERDRVKKKPSRRTSKPGDGSFAYPLVYSREISGMRTRRQSYFSPSISTKFLNISSNEVIVPSVQVDWRYCSAETSFSS